MSDYTDLVRRLRVSSSHGELAVAALESAKAIEALQERAERAEAALEKFELIKNGPRVSVTVNDIVDRLDRIESRLSAPGLGDSDE